jgi:hypothetical protein
MNIELIKEDILSFIKRGDISLSDGNSLLQNKLMMADENKWLTVPSKQYRKVHFCIVSLRP